MSKISRNAPCPCGSGKKFKQCCGKAGKVSSAVSVDLGLLRQSERFFKQGRLTEAWQGCQKILQSDPNNLQALRLSGAVAISGAQWRHAAEIFFRLHGLVPRDSAALINLAMAEYEQGEDDLALKHSQQALKLSPKRPEALNITGSVLRRLHRLEEAEQYYRKAVAYGAGNPNYSFNLAVALQDLGRLGEAEEIYRELLNNCPSFTQVHNNLGLVLTQMRRFDEAKATFEELLKLSPDNPETLNNIGSVLFDAGKLSEAEAYFKKAIELDSNSPKANINSGLIAMAKGSHETANEFFYKVLELNPGNAEAHVYIGHELFRLGETESAKQHLEKSLNKAPNNVMLLACYGEILLRAGSREAAREYIQRAVKLGEHDVSAHRALAVLKREEKDFRGSELEWKKVIELMPESPDGYIGLAKLYFSDGRIDDARAVFHDAEKRVCAEVKLYKAWCNLEERANNLETAKRLADKAAELSSNDPAIAIIQSKYCRREKDFTKALTELNCVDISKEKSNRIKSRYYFERGTVLDKLGQYMDAFEAYDQANKYKNRYLFSVYDESSDDKKLSVLRQSFTAEKCVNYNHLTDQLPEPEITPIFIVGFPRSGTSLLEQMLDQHPEITAAGELSFISELAAGKAQEILSCEEDGLDFLVDDHRPLVIEDLLKLRGYYLEQLKYKCEDSLSTSFVTDKMPHNAIQLGLISLLFPKSPIIHISRHPLDSCLSAYFSNFSGHRYTSSLPTTLIHYQKVMDMIEYYKSVLNMRLIEIRYQDLVDDQESILRKVLEFIGVAWDESCLSHHKSKRVVRTASYDQVTQKVYRSSLARYLNYWDAVEPHVHLVQETIDRFGYSLKEQSAE